MVNSMTAPTLPNNHPPVATGQVGVLLVNLGTPDAPTPKAVRRYLAEFLSDRRVVEIPALLWQPLLRGIILPLRGARSAKLYQTVMRYGQPSIAAQLAKMADAGCRRLLVVPMYPQYCGATTATVVDAVSAALAAMRWQPALRFLPPYHDDPAHIAALATSVTQQLAALPFEPDVLLASFHGMPQRTLDLGDPYHCQCRKTARLLGDALGRPVEVAFQSRFGRAKWLEPATENRLRDLGESGVKRVAVVAPGFAADCLETLEELAIRGREQFVEAGGTDYAYLSCLNAGEAGMAQMEALVRRELAGWV